MAGRRLDADERALWARVIASVTPLVPVRTKDDPVVPATEQPAIAPRRGRNIVAPSPPPSPQPRPAIGETLDGSWDRRLTRGAIIPDMAVDLHGHTLDSAYRLLDSSLDRAVRSGARVILLITGKPPRADLRGERPMRGVIRAAVGDWLSASRHAAHIATVRNAHPRHGGTGALYIILKRDRCAA
ncbi:Smr/MutS family protein [Sphingomonas cavernae]|uniref:DNA mismatch repair protein MutS n=1 Tax=Sphingomonas cavernae TaxID=2320861 RepID=A0A418WLP8_9SPHN|nr:Smr/MutS family protein [Sphingomonas cavernae]RJF90928.1 DNA mismatch repair protein MutS [Sphingomonas cavernae]